METQIGILKNEAQNMKGFSIIMHGKSGLFFLVEMKGSLVIMLLMISCVNFTFYSTHPVLEV